MTSCTKHIDLFIVQSYYPVLLQKLQATYGENSRDHGRDKAGNLHREHGTSVADPDQWFSADAVLWS
jgi:hypothetical protein